MQTLPIVEDFAVFEHGRLRLLAGSEADLVDVLGLERGEEALHGRVIEAVAAAAHGLRDAVPLQHRPVGLGRELVQKSDCRRGQVAWGAIRQCAGTPACPAGSSGSAPRRRPWPRSSGRAEPGRGGRGRWWSYNATWPPPPGVGCRIQSLFATPCAPCRPELTKRSKL